MTHQVSVSEDLKSLIPEIKELKKWLRDSAKSLDEDKNMKICDAASYLAILHCLIDICPDILLDKVVF